MKKSAIVIFGLAMLMVCAVVSPAFAVVFEPSPPYILTRGKLGGADYAIYMPKTWNGRLVMGCNGYNMFEDEHQELGFGPLATWLTSIGYAFASTNYNGGERAWLVREGIIRTHQLTQYIIDNYHVTGKIFVLGASMGGEIALDLAHKYPNLYSGVLDVCGAKDSSDGYSYGQVWINNNVSQIRSILGIPSVVPNSAIAGLKIFFTILWADLIEACGGTPVDKPQEYLKEDPIYHADLQIPTISLIGGIDLICPLQIHLNYKAAVIAAGSSDLYRQYVVPTGGHCDQTVLNEVPAKLLELFAWSDSLD